MYSKNAEKRDNIVADRWLKDAESIIIFVRGKAAFFITEY